jgi:hypothetical protein
MRARDINIALHAVIDEAWANGDFADNGRPYYDNPAVPFQGYDAVGSKNFSIDSLSSKAYSGDERELLRRAAELFGEEFIEVKTGGGWGIELFGANDPDTTAATADGFWLNIVPEGYGSDKSAIHVTYKLSHYDGAATVSGIQVALHDGSIVYDPNAGYEVYHLIAV